MAMAAFSRRWKRACLDDRDPKKSPAAFAAGLLVSREWPNAWKRPVDGRLLRRALVVRTKRRRGSRR